MNHLIQQNQLKTVAQFVCAAFGDIEPYLIQALPVITLAVVYAISGFEIAVVMGLAIIAGGVNRTD